MTMLVHLTSEKHVKAILRSGIIGVRRQGGSRVTFAMPMTPDFYISHQWVRELRRWRPSVMVGVYFRIPDEELVSVGRYNLPHRPMTVAQSLALMMEPGDRNGYEVIIPRPIQRKEIRRIKKLPQVVGWRYAPDAHGKPPCGCPVCSQGGYGSRRLREAYERQQL